MAAMLAGDSLNGSDISRIAWATRQAEENSGYSFTCYIAQPGQEGSVSERAHAVHAGLPGRERAVLVYVDPQEREVMVVTGAVAGRTLTDPECRLATATMVSSFASGDLVGGLVSGIIQLGEASRGLTSYHARPAVDR